MSLITSMYAAIPASPPSLSPLAARYLDIQLSGQRQRAVKLIMDEGIRRGYAVPDLHLEVIQSAQHAIGKLWEQNQITIAQEHVATAISQLVLSHLYAYLPRAPHKGKRVLVGCVEGDLHDMGARILTDFLEMGGYEVRLLGASVPTDTLVDAVQRERPHLVALSVSLSFHLPALQRAVERLRSDVGPTLPIAIGGHAVFWTPGLAERLGVMEAGTDAREFLQRLDEIFEER